MVRQLVEALLFEQLVEFEVRPLPRQARPRERPASVYRSNVDFKVGGDQVRGRSGGHHRLRAGARRRGFGQAGEGGDRPVDVRSLVRSLALDAETAGRLESELLQTVELCCWNHQNLAHHLDQGGLEFPKAECASGLEVVRQVLVVPAAKLDGLEQLRLETSCSLSHRARVNGPDYGRRQVGRLLTPQTEPSATRTRPKAVMAVRAAYWSPPTSKSTLDRCTEADRSRGLACRGTGTHLELHQLLEQKGLHQLTNHAPLG